MSQRIFNIVVLGNTGVGKSSLLNMFAGNSDAFLVGDNAISVTQLAVSKVYNFMGKENMPRLRLIDTQGLSDTGGDTKDMDHIKNMVNCIKELEQIDLFIICFDGTNPRFTAFAQSTVSLFSSIFPDFLFHSVLVFNKWNQPNPTKMVNLKKEYQELFSNLFKVKNIPCYFMDSYFNLCMLRDNDDGTQSERFLHPNIQQRTLAQVHELMNYLNLKDSRCDVRKIVPKDTEKTALTKQIADTHAKYKEEFKKLEEQRDKKIKEANEASKKEMEKMKVELQEQQNKKIKGLQEENDNKIKSLENQLEESKQNASNNNKKGFSLLDIVEFAINPVGKIIEAAKTSIEGTDVAKIIGAKS